MIKMTHATVLTCALSTVKTTRIVTTSAVTRCEYDDDNGVDNDMICGNVDSCRIDKENDADSDGMCSNHDVCP